MNVKKINSKVIDQYVADELLYWLLDDWYENNQKINDDKIFNFIFDLLEIKFDIHISKIIDITKEIYLNKGYPVIDGLINKFYVPFELRHLQ